MAESSIFGSEDGEVKRWSNGVLRMVSVFFLHRSSTPKLHHSNPKRMENEDFSSKLK